MTLQIYFSASQGHKFPSDNHHARLHCHIQSSLLILSISSCFQTISVKPTKTHAWSFPPPLAVTLRSHSSFQLPGCCLTGFCLKVYKKEMIDLCWPCYRLLHDSFSKEVCLCMGNTYKDIGHIHRAIISRYRSFIGKAHTFRCFDGLSSVLFLCLACSGILMTHLMHMLFLLEMAKVLYFKPVIPIWKLKLSLRKAFSPRLRIPLLFPINSNLKEAEQEKEIMIPCSHCTETLCSAEETAVILRHLPL